jgi:hypothetical protein
MCCSKPDVDRQTQAMFQARFDPSQGVLVSGPPSRAAGVPGLPVP